MGTSGRAAAMVAWSGLIQSSASRYTSYSAFPISSPIAWISIMMRISMMPTENLDCEDHLDSELLILRTNFGGHPPHIESHHAHRNHRLKNNTIGSQTVGAILHEQKLPTRNIHENIF